MYGTTRYCGTITNRRIIKTQNGGGDKKTGRIEDIVCSDVSFAYTEKPVIRNFNMRAHKNTKIVLSGKNGSGKTTVAKLLLGFYKNYSGSLLDNLRYISPDLKEQEVMAAMK